MWNKIKYNAPYIVALVILGASVLANKAKDEYIYEHVAPDTKNDILILCTHVNRLEQRYHDTITIDCASLYTAGDDDDTGKKR